MSSREDFKKILDEHERRISELEKILRSQPEPKRKPLAIREFILEKQPKNEWQKTLIIAYYLEKYSGLNSFNTRDLEGGFRDAREKVPKNISDTVYKNIAKGYMMEAEEKKDDLMACNLTNTGATFVESGLKSE